MSPPFSSRKVARWPTRQMLPKRRSFQCTVARRDICFSVETDWYLVHINRRTRNARAKRGPITLVRVAPRGG